MQPSIHVFNDLEGLRIAVAIEKRGVDMYRRAFSIAKNERALETLKRLAADEQMHADTFHAMYERAVKRYEESGEEPVQYDSETNAFLSAMAAEVVFSDGLVSLAIRADGFDDPAKVLTQAIQAEKDSILYYTECERRAYDHEAKATFARILGEERGHLLELQTWLLEETGEQPEENT